MNNGENHEAAGAVPELPPFSLDVQALDLGPDVKAVGLELVETENREPVRGRDATELWAAVLPAICADEPYVVDFFSHVDRVRDLCSAREIPFREAAGRCLVLPQPPQEHLKLLLDRFAKETFGLRCGPATQTPDAELEQELSRRGLDAYRNAYRRYTLTAVCEPEDGWVTILSDTLWPTEIIRRLRPAVQPFDVHIARPQ